MMIIRTLKQTLQRVSIATRSRCGFLIALVMVITISVREAVRNIAVLNRNEVIVCITVAGIGFVSWLTGGIRELNLAVTAAAPGTGRSMARSDDALAFLRSAKYWGLIFLLSATVITVLALCRRSTPVLHVQARPLPKVVPVVAVTNEPRQIVFPDLELQGLVVNGNRSSAMINGRVLQLGEDIANVVLVAVDSAHATVMLEGQTNVLTLRK